MTTPTQAQIEAQLALCERRLAHSEELRTGLVAKIHALTAAAYVDAQVERYVTLGKAVELRRHFMKLLMALQGVTDETRRMLKVWQATRAPRSRRRG